MASRVFGAAGSAVGHLCCLRSICRDGLGRDSPVVYSGEAFRDGWGRSDTCWSAAWPCPARTGALARSPVGTPLIDPLFPPQLRWIETTPGRGGSFTPPPGQLLP